MMVRLLWLSIAFIALGCASPARVIDAPPLVPGSNETLVVDHAIIIADASGSIGNRFPSEKALLQGFAQAMPQGRYSAGGIAFGGSDRSQFPQQRFDRERVRSEVDDIRYIGSGTPLDEVLKDTRRSLDRNGTAAIVLFSDGEPTFANSGVPQDPEKVLQAARDLKASRNGKTCFHTVQVGDSPVGAALLQNLASLGNCGSFRHADAINDVGSLHTFQRQVFLGALPQVAAKPRWVLRGPNFATDSAQIRSKYQPKLEEVVNAMRQDPAMRIRLDGHTDSRGSAQHNQALSERRAKSVKQYLVERGIDDGRIETQGWGFERPIRPNDTAENMYENRRTEVTVIAD